MGYIEAEKAYGAMIGKSNAVLLALLLALPTTFLATAYLAPAFGQTNYSAWLKIVTDSWDGINYFGFQTPVNPDGIGFADRYNVTNVCVELYRFKNPGGLNPAPLIQYDGPINAGSPNGTGFIRISWPASWENVTIIVKAKSYQGDCIGAGKPFQGIIVYWLTVNGTASFLNRFFGTTTNANYTIGDDGLLWTHPGPDFDYTINAPFNAGPVDHMDMFPAWFAAAHSDPRNASVAHAAYIFKLFHEHTWYATNDTLAYATIFVYDTDHTPAGSTESLVQAAITGPDGQSRYTREIFPASEGVGEFDRTPGKFAGNKLVPIPLQIINRFNATPFHGGIPDPDVTGIPIGAPHLNATKRVWWETVLTNQTFYVGREYNTTSLVEFFTDPGTGKTRPAFGAYPAFPAINPTRTQGGITGVPAGPFSLALNNTVPNRLTWSGGWDFTGNQTDVANFNNNTVFYARFCVQDADLKIQHFEVGDKLVNAEVTVNLKRTGAVQPYYLTHNILTTDNGGCTDDPHKWPGYVTSWGDPADVDDDSVTAGEATWFDKMARFPNGTNWGLRGSLNVSKAFDPRDDSSPVWRPGGYFERAWGGSWMGPYNNAGKSWSNLIPEITYMKTRQLSDDINYDGFDVQVKWKGGSRNAYGGTAVLVDSIRVPNPYAIATLYNYATEAPWGGWVFPTTPLANNKLLVRVHSSSAATFSIDTDGDGVGDVTSTIPGFSGTLEIMGAGTLDLGNYDRTAEKFEIDISTDSWSLNPWMAVNIVENRTDRWVDYFNVTDIRIEDANATIKKHDSPFIDGSAGLEIVFEQETGVIDFNADGIGEHTGILSVEVDSGPFEMEFWPGAPGDNEIRVLISAHDVQLRWVADSGPSIRDDFTGTVLIRGSPNTGTFLDYNEQEGNGAGLTDTDLYPARTLTLSDLDVRPRFPSPLQKTVIGGTHRSFPVPDVTGWNVTNGIVFERLPKSRILNMSLFGEHNLTLQVLQKGNISIGLYKGEFGYKNATGWHNATVTGTLTSWLDVGENINITSKVVPLFDFSNDDREYDDWIFGGYDDFALTGSGIVYITAWVHDIGFRVLDNMGNPLPASNTAVTLHRPGNGPDVTKSGAGFDPDRLVGGLQFSYKMHGDGWAVFYQLPGDQAYGVTVTFDGRVVYDEPFEIDKLTKTELIPIVTRVFKLKMVFVDCAELPLGGAIIKYVEPGGRTVITKIDDHGALDTGYVAGGDITVIGLWWKGVWVPFDKATVGDEELPLNPDGSLTLPIDRNYDSPPVLRAVINDFIFTPWDFNMDTRIPRLNITLMWVGVSPTTGERLYFVETLDPSGDTWDGNLPEADDSDDGNARNDFNTSVTLHQWFSYKIEYNQGDVSDSNSIRSYGTVKYIFYQMPPTYYNITVTTVPHLVEPNGQNGEDWSTPSTSKWPGRNVLVEYEAKILWGASDISTFTTDDLRNPPLEAWKRASYSNGKWSFTSPPDSGWASYANDRIVLRVFGTMGGVPVTDPNLNPGGVGDQTARVCGPRQIDLATWAHNFYKRIVDGDFDYLTQATRIGNVTFFIRNDNGINMEHYDPVDKVWVEQHTSNWTSDLWNPSRIKSTSEWSSTIWWNGSYAAHSLQFYDYVYPLQLSRGEQPWARFYDRVGLSGTGWLTTQKGPITSPGGDVRPGDSFVIDKFFNVTTGFWDNGKWPTHNFTVVGNEGLWNQQKWRWEKAVEDELVPEVPWRPYSLVFEKEVLTMPIPVGFITLNLKDEDLARPIPYAVVQLDIYDDTHTTAVSSVLYKTGRDGNLTLLYPTQEAMENILGTNVVNYTLTVYWYLNSSIVYKDAFNLTKRGYSVDKVAIADVTFVLAISANKDRPVRDLYARIWWFNVTDPRTDPAKITVFPGRITVDHAKKTWTYTAVPETRGAAKWTTGQLTLPWLPTSERFTKRDWNLTYSSESKRWVYEEVTRTWDIPFPSYDNGSMIEGWPYSPVPTGYDRRHPHLTNEENRRIQYRISVWSDQLPIDPSLPSFTKGAWSTAAPNPATGTNYELVWTRLSTGDTSVPVFRFAWMLFGHEFPDGMPGYSITFYRGPDAVGMFQPIPGYALTRTWTATPTPGSKTVAIKLNATDVDIPVFWQVGDTELGTYDCGPLVGYIVKGRIEPPKGATYSPITIDAVTTAGKIQIGDKTVEICLAEKPVGLVRYTSGSTVPTVVWGTSWTGLHLDPHSGSRIVIEEVSPPPSIWYNDGTGQAGADNPNRGTTSNYWKNWVSQATDPVTGQPVKLTVGDQLQIPGVDLGIQYMGYGRPYEGMPREVSVVAFSNDPDNFQHRPFIKMFEFQNVSARITDFNGRALPGAFYQLIDAQTSKSAAWSYAGPDGRIVPMPIRKPGGVFIQRVTYLGIGANGEPTWPVNSFAKWPIAYDSRDDETTQETQKPDIPIGFTYTTEAGPWPTGDGWRPFGTFTIPPICSFIDGDNYYNYTANGAWLDEVFDYGPGPSILDWIAACPPAGWGRHFDVITRIFDLRVRFVYGDAQRPADPDYVFTAPSLALPDQFTISGKGAIFEAKRLARSTYDIVAYWPTRDGEEVGRRTFDISRANVGTVEGTVTLALRDVSFAIVDRQGRPLLGATVAVSPDLMRPEDKQQRPDGIFSLVRIPDGRTYEFKVTWTHPDFGTSASASVRDTPAGLQDRGSITLPVDDVQIKVVDFDDRPVAGAAITFQGKDVGKTDSQGIIIVGQVPLDNTYQIAVSKDGTNLGGDSVRFTASRLTATLQVGIYDVVVLVKGAAGQPIPGATVELRKGGAVIKTGATDDSGQVVFQKVIGDDYTVNAVFDPFTASRDLPKGTRSATLTIDLYTVLFGVPMTFATFLALIIGLILLVIVVAVIVSEYIRWRGRRLGIYPAPPPKK
ncbi:hypothetical protein HRbin01_01747 [archaeon HR01]|nr:hypothetical protein HRbin01_01747 [archaeon HR01]